MNRVHSYQLYIIANFSANKNLKVPKRAITCILRVSRMTTQTPNRFTTTVAIECYIDDRLRRVRWFSDMQMAYLWTKRQVEQSPTEEWDVDSFQEACNMMDSRWARGQQEAYCVAQGDSVCFYFRYEPSVNYETIRINNPSPTDTEPITGAINLDIDDDEYLRG